jgi:glucokinase
VDNSDGTVGVRGGADRGADITTIAHAAAMGVRQAATILAFDIGGTRIKAGLVRAATVSALTIVPTKGSDGHTDVLDTVIRLGRRLMADQDVAGIGLSVKGIVDPTRGVLIDVNDALADWIGQPLTEIIAHELERPTCLENDARMYTLGEFRHGAGYGHRNMVCLTLGTGIGSGVVLGGCVLRGPRGTAGILGGQLTVQVDGAVCTCGNIGCLETLINAAALVRSTMALLAEGRASTLHGGDLTARHIFAAAAAGDTLALEVVERFARYLGAGVVNMIHAHDPEVVVLGGGMAHASPLFLPAVQTYVDAHVWTVPDRRVPVVPALLADAAALVGVAELARGAEIFL